MYGEEDGIWRESGPRGATWATWYAAWLAILTIVGPLKRQSPSEPVSKWAWSLDFLKKTPTKTLLYKISPCFSRYIRVLDKRAGLI